MQKTNIDNVCVPLTMYCVFLTMYCTYIPNARLIGSGDPNNLVCNLLNTLQCVCAVSTLYAPVGDYAILLSTGMKWYIAAIYNLVSALTAVVGLFIGVAIGNVSEMATSWIFMIAAGIFLYVALVDMVSCCLVVCC